jgi:uncharacterized protein (DUF58 family)
LLFDLDSLADGPALPLRARLIVEGALSGMHRARLKGSSVEFEQHKEYSPGDELRHLDWKVYAKADRYYVKQFEQESELTAYLVLDASGSMAYRGQSSSKLGYGAHIVAALAHLLIHQRDKVGLYAFGDQNLERLVPPRARVTHLRDLFAVLEDICARGASGDEPLATALERVGELAGRRRGMIVLVSDLFDPSERGLEVLSWLRARGHDVVVFQVLDDHELELPFEGLTLFKSLESDAELLTNPTAIRREYRRRMRTFLERVDESCKTAGIEYRQITTSKPLADLIREFVGRRLLPGGRA